MPILSNWLESSLNRLSTAAQRAALAYNRIEDKPTSITVRRGSATLWPQTVRVEYFQGTSLREGQTAIATPGSQVAIIFGVRDHPTVPDTDLKRGDRFAIGAVQFEVITTITTRGELQAQAESIVLEGS